MKILKSFIYTAIICTIISCNANNKKEEIALKEPVQVSIPTTKHYIKVALLLDTSNSMDGLIDQAKAQLWEIVNELSYAKCKGQQPNLQIALYEYGNDSLYEKDGYTRKVLGFTEDLDEVSKELFSLTTNGGSEYCGTVIQKALNKLDWGKDRDDLKMVFIAGNEPFNQGSIKYEDAITNAKEKDVVVNTIFCGNYEQGIDIKWKKGAQLGYGEYTAIDHNQQTTHIASPYDDQILQLNIKLNNTYIPYGSKGRAKVAMQYEQDENAMEYSKANAVSRTVSKGSHLYKNESWDLVDAAKKKDFDYRKMKNEFLPKTLQDKSSEEIEAYVTSKGEERKIIQEKIAALNKERREHISNEKKGADNGLESAMIKALKKQAEKKNYSW